MLLHNDPYTGGTHLNDVAVIYPIFFKENLTMFVVIRSHWADIGGTTPGSLSGKAKEILHEGLRLNHICVPKNGKSEVMDLIFDNIRISEEALSDFYAVLGTCRVAERRLIELISKYGLEVTLKSIDNSLLSVTVIDDNSATYADAFATAFNAMGKDLAIEIANKNGIATMLIYVDNDKSNIIYSSKWNELIL